MKINKKIVTVSLVAALAATTIIGGTMAYFTDTDNKDNVFTTGKVDITLKENFEQNSKLIPATGSVEAGTLQNGVTKEVSVKNEKKSEDAYVRVHIAIPKILDEGAEDLDVIGNVLHFNYDPNSIGEGKWDWSKTADEPYEGDWNYYETTIDNINYNVYVATYESKLVAGATTSEKAMHQVYLDSGVSNSDIAKINKVLGENWEIKVVAEGAQAAGFDDAYDALNTAFGVPGTYNPWE